LGVGDLGVDREALLRDGGEVLLSLLVFDDDDDDDDDSPCDEEAEFLRVEGTEEPLGVEAGLLSPVEEEEEEEVFDGGGVSCGDGALFEKELDEERLFILSLLLLLLTLSFPDNVFRKMGCEFSLPLAVPRGLGSALS
jgi:hypothetical protein